MKVVGIHGLAGSGKDTVAELIRNYYTDKVALYAFADPLKEACAVAFGVPVSHFYDETMKERIDEFWGITYRDMLQRFGTEAMRNTFRQDFWLLRAENYIKHIEDADYDLLIITDVRFENEAKWVEDIGGIYIDVIREDLKHGEKHNHISEQGIKNIEPAWTVANDGSLEDLRESVALLAKFIGET